MRSKLSSRVLSVLLALVLVLSTLSTMAFAAGEKSDDVVVLYTNDVHCGVDAGTPEDTMGYANLAAYKHAMEEAHELTPATPSRARPLAPCPTAATWWTS